MSMCTTGRLFCVGLVTGLSLIGLWRVQPSCALDIELTFGPGVLTLPPADAAKVIGAATDAATRWEAVLTDPITVKFGVDVLPMGPTALGFFDVDAPGVTGTFAYDAVKSVLATDAASARDALAVANLQTGPSLNVISNTTSTTPSARMQFVPGTHDFIFNSFLRLTRANQKALALLPATHGLPAEDGSLKINLAKLATFDYIPGDGITAGTTDAVAVFMHEMGHGLGFIGGVDHVDYAGEKGFVRGRPAGYPADTVIVDDAIMSVLDLYRYSDDSITAADQPSVGAVLDWAFDAASPLPLDNPYFSLDAGVTPMGFFATGEYNGDGSQAQHWKSNTSPLVGGTPLGLMDPSIAFGEMGALTMLDLAAMDVIGYQVVPEPTSLAVLLLTATVSLRLRERHFFR